MTEYIKITTEPTDDPDQMWLYTNLALNPDGETEQYITPQAGDVGSPLAQSLFAAPGLYALTIEEKDMLVTREPDVPWPDLVEDLSDILRDFFL